MGRSPQPSVLSVEEVVLWNCTLDYHVSCLPHNLFLAASEYPVIIQANWLHTIFPLWQFNYLHRDTFSRLRMFCFASVGLAHTAGCWVYWARLATQRSREGEAFQMFPRYFRLVWCVRLLLQIGMRATLANIDGVLAREDDKLLAKSCKRQKHSVTPKKAYKVP